MKRAASVTLVIGLAIGLAAGCADAPELGSARFPLTEANFFRLRIFEAPADMLSGQDPVFDTGCIQRQSRTYELSNIPVGSGYAVVYEGFAIASCAETSRVEIGFRGLVDIEKGKEPYYHVPVYPAGRVAPLPENLNLSASVAEPIDFCDGADDCGGELDVCYDVARPEYWCVPSCRADADCVDLHPLATCDLATEWCMLRSPYPFNLSEPRAWGAAVTLPDGDVLFVGGLRDSPGGFGPTRHWLERFDAELGLLAPAEVTGAESVPAGRFGFASLSSQRHVTVGGVRALSGVAWNPAGEGLVVEAEWSTALMDSIVVFEPDASGAGGRATSSSLSRAVSEPAVLPLGADRFWVAGGLVVSGPTLAATKATSVCTVAEDLSVTCEAGVELKQPRFAPAVACLDAACARVLVVGGNVSGRVGEIVDLGAQTVEALETLGLADKAFYPRLCGNLLVGGSALASSPQPFPPVRLSIDGRLLEGSALQGAATTSVLLGALVGGQTTFADPAGCLIGGGFGGDGALAAIHQAGASGVVKVADATFGQARFAAVGAVIGAGVLDGRVVFGGGLAFPAGIGPAQVVRGLEVFTP
ncbi:MAG: hypothetical protein IT385_24205 [Deltaproteobacteria bacterium]|nr:hypothetical protein [Deltaproteobacteria bacterium]